MATTALMALANSSAVGIYNIQKGADLIFGNCFPHDPSSSLIDVFLVCQEFVNFQRGVHPNGS
jgi:hypothetical protein